MFSNVQIWWCFGQILIVLHYWGCFFSLVINTAFWKGNTVFPIQWPTPLLFTSSPTAHPVTDLCLSIHSNTHAIIRAPSQRSCKQFKNFQISLENKSFVYKEKGSESNSWLARRALPPRPSPWIPRESCLNPPHSNTKIFFSCVVWRENSFHFIIKLSVAELQKKINLN